MKDSKASLSDFRDWAVGQALNLRKISLPAFGSSVRYKSKKDGSPVTALDRKCEQFFRKSVLKKFPAHGILGEEFGEERAGADWIWVIDPIDGTRPFSRGLPTWGSLITLLYKGEPTVAVADYPAMNTLLWAVKGGGAWEGLPGRKPKRLKVSKVARFQDAAVLHSGAAFFAGTENEAPIVSILKECYLERGYGDCFAYWQMLKGSADLVLDFGVKIWDLAPFVLMAEEAGGKLLDFAGKRRWAGPQAVSGNPRLVDDFISRLSR